MGLHSYNEGNETGPGAAGLIPGHRGAALRIGIVYHGVIETRHITKPPGFYKLQMGKLRNDANLHLGPKIGEKNTET